MSVEKNQCFILLNVRLVPTRCIHFQYFMFKVPPRVMKYFLNGWNISRIHEIHWKQNSNNDVSGVCLRGECCSIEINRAVLRVFSCQIKRRSNAFTGFVSVYSFTSSKKGWIAMLLKIEVVVLLKAFGTQKVALKGKHTLTLLKTKTL